MEYMIKKDPASWIQWHIKNIIHQGQVRFIPGIQGCFVNIYINKMKEKCHRIISTDVGTTFDKIQHAFMMKNLHNWVE
jgi:hypothetical protein